MVKKRTILVVDDALDVRKILGFHLGNKGYEVLEASDGLQGLKMIEAATPDLLILDINMPKMSGIEVYNNLLKNKKRLLFPIIVLTSREELRALFKDLEVEGFINKPFEISNVLENIDAVMQKRYSLGESQSARKVTGPVKVLMVENNKEVFEQLLLAFSTAGFAVNYAESGVDAMEKLMVYIPQLIMVNLGLLELSGDVFVMKLKAMPRTMDIPCLLYTPHPETMLSEIINRIYACTKSKLLPCDPAVLLKEANALFRE